MYAGRIVETGPTRTLFHNPRHPYTQGLLRAVPRLDHPPKQPLPTISGSVPNLLHLPVGCRFRARCPWAQERCAQEEPNLLPVAEGHRSACWVMPAFDATTPTGEQTSCGRSIMSEQNGYDGAGTVGKELIRVENLTKHFPLRGGLWGRSQGVVRAVDTVSFTVMQGETLGLVGESGSGKSTLGRLLLRLLEPTLGKAYYEGRDIHAATGESLRRLHQQMQIVFQDPYGSLNPRMTVGRTLLEGLELRNLPTRQEREAEVSRLLEMVGLRPRIP